MAKSSCELDATAWLVIIIAVLKVVKVIIDEVKD